MSLACKIFASLLLIFNLSAQETNVVQVLGTLNRSITLDVPNQQLSDVDDIKWFKNNSRLVRIKGGTVKGTVHEQPKGYEVSVNGSLTIKHLQRSDNTNFQIVVYNKAGIQIFTRTFNLRILEMVSKPEISWNCTTTTLTCKVTNGTDPKLKLYRGQTYIKGGQKVIEYKWITKQKTSFKCTANNTVSEETSEVDLTCPGTWQALLRHAKFTSQTQPARPMVETYPRAQVPGPGGSLDSREGPGHLPHHWHLWRRRSLPALCGTAHPLRQQQEKNAQKEK
ncbi:T-cell surface antigen CD2 isoform X2 [Phyllostomus hastatus]|uniref:T-cell surface antigen CD2 isoform X2 n=1 Tax=Phyllostomus hastatus TaxID=9423 RepID=UPI001E67E824|nr:T-cell surface antigen CD2 isoform X2 [Phyllostomus hastatus]